MASLSRINSLLRCSAVFDARRMRDSELARHNAGSLDAALDAFDLTYQPCYAVQLVRRPQFFDAPPDDLGARKTDDSFFRLGEKQRYAARTRAHEVIIFLASVSRCPPIARFLRAYGQPPSADLPIYFLGYGKHFVKTWTIAIR